jgi:hypothetical protein
VTRRRVDYNLELSFKLRGAATAQADASNGQAFWTICAFACTSERRRQQPVNRLEEDMIACLSRAEQNLILKSRYSELLLPSAYTNCTSADGGAYVVCLSWTAKTSACIHDLSNAATPNLQLEELLNDRVTGQVH